MKKKENKCNNIQGCGGCAYMLGIIGAAVYYISATTGFWNTLLAILKALVWPAFLVFDLLKFIGA
jgi:hypothetical protein